MRVLQVHNRYRSNVPSGENMVVDAEAVLLKQHGVEVLRHIRSSDEIDGMQWSQKALVPLRPFHSPQDVRAIRQILQDKRPNVLHLHNPNPLISMAVVEAAASAAVPVVMTSHNYRHTCVSGVFHRDGHVCHDCRGKSVPWPAVAHGCYRDSRLQSVVAVSALMAHRSSYARVACHIAVCSAMRDSLVAAGIAPDRIVIKPNSVPDPGPDVPPIDVAPTSRPRFLFVGRLAEQKGVRLALDAWCQHPVGSLGQLAFVGSGPLEPLVREVAAGRSDVQFLGQLDPAGVAREMEAATVVLVPSLGEEAFGLVVIEAYARRRPVVSTGLGGLSDLLLPKTSWKVAPSADAWAAQLAAITLTEAAARGECARARYESTYDPDIVTSQLIEIYRELAGHDRRIL